MPLLLFARLWLKSWQLRQFAAILWRSYPTYQGMWVLTVSERETMQEMMEREKAEAIRTLNRANRALGRIFNLEEKENDDEHNAS